MFGINDEMLNQMNEAAMKEQAFKEAILDTLNDIGYYLAMLCGKENEWEYHDMK